MIHDLDATIERLLSDELRPFGFNSHELDVSFEPPTSSFGNKLSKASVVNCYAYFIGENRDMVDLQPRHARQPNGTIISQRLPAWIDVHYLVTAWSQAATDTTAAEHRLLSHVALVLLRHQRLVPADIFGGVFPGGFNTTMQQARMPAIIARPDSLEHLGEFWSTMDNTWRPALLYVVSMPLDFDVPIVEFMVTSKVTDYMHTDDESTSAASADTLIQIGGRVFDPAAPALNIPKAVVQLKEVGLTTETDDQGRYTFLALQAGIYTVYVRAAGYRPTETVIHVTGALTEYDVAL